MSITRIPEGIVMVALALHLPVWAGDVTELCRQLVNQQAYTEAYPACKQAADRGSAFAQNSLGVMHGRGLGVLKNHAESIKWFRKAAEQGFAKAQYNLGVIYSKGLGVRQDYAKAITWYRKAAAQDNADAQYNLGVLYANGDGVAQNGATAADWYYKAGLAYLREADKDSALLCVKRIRELTSKHHLKVPNAFLADQLLRTIHSSA
jgi:TPR repeat protein